MRPRAAIVGGVLLAVLAATWAWAGPAPAAGPAAGGFSPNVTNPWFPLQPGTTLVYRGSRDGRPAVEYLTVSHQTQAVGGAPCRVVFGRLYLGGHLAETTRDYYNQDRTGTVWYYGEDTAELDRHGHLLSIEGTWHAGVDGARPGIFMPARPRVGASYRQEFYRGHAEDHFQILDLAASVAVPYDRFRHAMLTREWTPLEPGVLDHEYYVQGIGTVREVTVRGGSEQQLVLVDVRSG